VTKSAVVEASATWTPAQQREAEQRCLPSDVDLAAVFRSPEIEGLYGFKPVPQSRDYTCGAAAVASVLRFLGEETHEMQCAQSMGTNKIIGTDAGQMVLYFRHRGYLATATSETPVGLIIERVRKGKITLVDWNDYGGHWVVVAGYDPVHDAIVLADPARPRSKFAAHSRKRFWEHWHCPAFGQAAPSGKPGRYTRLAVTVDVPVRGKATKDLKSTYAKVQSYYKGARRNWDREADEFPG
jgi:hypothetical protein